MVIYTYLYLGLVFMVSWSCVRVVSVVRLPALPGFFCFLGLSRPRSSPLHLILSTQAVIDTDRPI
jgi:hypothetical protein